MKKLFVALDLPASIRKALTAVQPKPRQTIRLVDPAQMHVTLYYIGDADLRQILDTLGQIGGQAFSLTIQGLGQFQSTSGTTILWAGVQGPSQLHQLHNDIASALHGLGIQKKTRQYTPHVTLARCKSGTPADVFKTFLRQEARMKLCAVQITKFGLYTSHIVNNTLVYTLEQSYCLKTTQQ